MNKKTGFSVVLKRSVDIDSCALCQTKHSEMTERAEDTIDGNSTKKGGMPMFMMFSGRSDMTKQM